MRTRNVILWSAGILLGLALLVAAGASVVAALTVSRNPFDFVPMKIAPETVQRIQERLSGELATALYGEKLEPARRFELTVDETNGILDSAIASAKAWGMLNNPGGKPMEFDALFADGVLRVRVTKRTPFWTPFGSCVNVTVFFAPQIKDEQVTLGLRSIIVGKIPLPQFVISKQNATQSHVIMATPQTAMLMAVVKELTLEKDKVIIVYSPDKLKEAVAGSMLNMAGPAMLNSP